MGKIRHTIKAGLSKSEPERKENGKNPSYLQGFLLRKLNGIWMKPFFFPGFGKEKKVHNWLHTAGVLCLERLRASKG